MLQEIAEQPAAVADTLLGRFAGGRIVLDEQRLSDQELREESARSFTVARGTAYHPGCWPSCAIERWTRVPVEVELASEFRYRDLPVLTAALRLSPYPPGPTPCVYTRAGPEIGRGEPNDLPGARVAAKLSRSAAAGGLKATRGTKVPRRGRAGSTGLGGHARPHPAEVLRHVDHAADLGRRFSAVFCRPLPWAAMS